MSYHIVKSNDCNENRYPTCNKSCNTHIKNLYNQCINPCTLNVLNCPNNPPNVPKLQDKCGKAIYVFNKICDNELLNISDLNWFIDLNSVCNYGCINTFTLGTTGITAGDSMNINFNNVNYYCNGIGDWFQIKNLTLAGITIYVNFNSSNILHTILDPQVDAIPYLDYRKYTIYKVEKDNSTASLSQTNYWMTF